MCALLERGLTAIAPQIAPEPDAVDGEQKDRADGRDRDGMLARAVADGVREPEQDDDEDGEQEERRRVVRQPLPEAHHAVSRRERAGDDRQAEDEQRVREQRAEDRRLCDDDLAGREREEDDEELGQVPERRLQHAGQLQAPKRVPTASVAIPIAQASPASAAAANRNTATGLDVREMEHAGDDAKRRGSRRRVAARPPAKAGQSPCARTSSRGWARSPRGPCPRPREHPPQLALVRAERVVALLDRREQLDHGLGDALLERAVALPVELRLDLARSSARGDGHDLDQVRDARASPRDRGAPRSPSR